MCNDLGLARQEVSNLSWLRILDPLFPLSKVHEQRLVQSEVLAIYLAQFSFILNLLGVQTPSSVPTAATRTVIIPAWLLARGHY